MKKNYASFFTILFSLAAFGQQIDNGSMENWDNLGSNDEEPSNWNSFMNASGGLSLFASKQVGQSTDIRSGASGMYSARVFSKSTIGIIANGNLTLGRINMGSSTPSSTSNYNYTVTGNSDFSQQLNSTPDSIVFWVKYNNSSSSDLARIKAIIHDDYDYVDPMTSESEQHVVADAALNFESTNGSWVRKSVPFDYVGPSTTPEYILVTFTTNMIPGGGSNGDEIFIDDVELIYSTSGLADFSNKHWVAYNESGLFFSNNFESDAIFQVFSMAGTLIYSGTRGQLSGMNLNQGMYLITNNIDSFKVVAH
ncbi:MAG: hypothetical protein CBB76_09355 [Crocinitomicaceae bacterium TMED16]|nr:MAG: hypothetical protein CBB76_09355 [Crocinitomicaceae bacterium TMED16]